MSKLRDFECSQDAQLFWENLATNGYLRLASYETVYWDNWFNSLDRSFIQLFWVYLPAPVDEAQLARISELKGICPPALGPSVPRSLIKQKHTPAQRKTY